jgi:hypothetical protein
MGPDRHEPSPSLGPDAARGSGMRMWEEYASKKAECNQIAKTAAFNLFRKAISGCTNLAVHATHT